MEYKQVIDEYFPIFFGATWGGKNCINTMYMIMDFNQKNIQVKATRENFGDPDDPSYPYLFVVYQTTKGTFSTQMIPEGQTLRIIYDDDSKNRKDWEFSETGVEILEAAFGSDIVTPQLQEFLSNGNGKIYVENWRQQFKNYAKYDKRILTVIYRRVGSQYPEMKIISANPHLHIKNPFDDQNELSKTKLQIPIDEVYSVTSLFKPLKSCGLQLNNRLVSINGDGYLYVQQQKETIPSNFILEWPDDNPKTFKLKDSQTSHYVIVDNEGKLSACGYNPEQASKFQILQIKTKEFKLMVVDRGIVGFGAGDVLLCQDFDPMSPLTSINIVINLEKMHQKRLLHQHASGTLVNPHFYELIIWLCFLPVSTGTFYYILTDKIETGAFALGKLISNYVGLEEKLASILSKVIANPLTSGSLFAASVAVFASFADFGALWELIKNIIYLCTESLGWFVATMLMDLIFTIFAPEEQAIKATAGFILWAGRASYIAYKFIYDQQHSNRLQLGQKLTPGQYMKSTNDHWWLIFQKDTNLVLLYQDLLPHILSGTPEWFTWHDPYTYKQCEFECLELDKKGVLKLKSSSGADIPADLLNWTGPGAQYFELTDDGQLYLKNKDNQIVFDVLAAVRQQDRLHPGQSLLQGQTLASYENDWTLNMQEDTNLVLKKGAEHKWHTWTTYDYINCNFQSLLFDKTGLLQLQPLSKYYPLPDNVKDWKSDYARTFRVTKDGELALFDLNGKAVYVIKPAE